MQKEGLRRIHDRFLRDHVFRRMIENDRDEEVCCAWDVLAQEDHTYRMSQAEYFHYRQNWWISLKKSGNDTQPLRKRSDFKQALSTLNRLHKKLEDNNSSRCPLKVQAKPASSSSSTWWQWRECWWSS